MDRIGASKYFIPLTDYLIKTLDQGEYSFKNIETTPIYNLISMARHGIYNLSDMMSWKRASNMLPFLRYEQERTFRKYDNISFQSFIDTVNLPKELQLIFITFSRAFFAEPKYPRCARLYLPGGVGLRPDRLHSGRIGRPVFLLNVLAWIKCLKYKMPKLPKFNVFHQF